MKSLRRSGLAAVCALSIASSPAVANVEVGSSGWQWGNPQPQGNTLRAMAFAGATGYAVGDFGTLLQTSDGGASWTGLRAGTFANLSRVQVLDPNTVFAAGGCVARRSTDGGRTFTRIAFTPVESTCPDKSKLAALSFLDANHGYLVLADGSVFETSDGGTEFAPKTGVPGTPVTGGPVVVTDLVFIGPTTGFATTNSGKVFATTDSGNSWKPVSDNSRALSAITFVSPQRGYAVGAGSLFLVTADGGQTWTPKSVGGTGPVNLTAIRCATEHRCVATTDSGAVLVRTDDGGDSFSFSTPATARMLAAAFASPTRVVAGGESGAMVTSDDGGLNFAPVGGRLVGTFSSLRLGSVAGSAYAPGPNGTLGKTVDGGRTWTRGNVTTSQDVLDVSFPTLADGYALDAAGGLFRTSSGGATWKTLDTGSTARPAAVLATSASTVMAIGPTGIRRSTDGGGSFDAVRGKFVAHLQLSAVDAAGKAVVAYGSQELSLSADAGRTWKGVKKPGVYRKQGRHYVNRLGIRRVDFVDARTGYLLDAQGRLWRTADAGRRWTELPAVGTDRARGMSFSDGRHGYLVIDRFGDVGGRTGFLMRTDDGGRTWHPQFVESAPIPSQGIAAAGATDYLLGGSAALLFSTSGGDSGDASALTIRAPQTSYRKAAHITVTGRLAPAGGNERVTVSYRRPGSSRWTSQTATVSANGRFTTSWNLARGDNRFVAQWQGDFRSEGDGSTVLTVKVGRAAGK